jgi:hypothetical protein
LVLALACEHHQPSCADELHPVHSSLLLLLILLLFVSCQRRQSADQS